MIEADTPVRMRMRVFALIIGMFLVACGNQDEEAGALLKRMSEAGVPCGGADIVFGPLYTCTLAQGGPIDFRVFDDEDEAHEYALSGSRGSYAVWGPDYVFFIGNLGDAREVAEALDGHIIHP
jgi:hypothetical protein